MYFNLLDLGVFCWEVVGMNSKLLGACNRSNLKMTTLLMRFLRSVMIAHLFVLHIVSIFHLY